MPENDRARLHDAISPIAFLQSFIQDVAGSLEEVVGLEEAKGYMSVVGGQMGSRLAEMMIDDTDRDADVAGGWSTAHLGEVLVDIETKIGGTFRAEPGRDGTLTLVNDRCPFGTEVVGRPSLCMVTSNLFGRIAAERLGHVSVEISESIARGDGRCVVHLATQPGLELGDDTRHYFGDY